MMVNILWPFVPAAIAIHFARPDLHLWIFILNYVAMIPTANLVGFAGQELARKLPKVLGKPPSCDLVEGHPSHPLFQGSHSSRCRILMVFCQALFSKRSLVV